MIPKIIHYCWFGGNPLPPLAEKCIASWKKYFPEYEIKEWNENNFNMHIATYTTEAYGEKKYAFVSDYARFWILYNYGGIYFDTDVEVIKAFPLDISEKPFFGLEKCGNRVMCNPGLGMACDKGNPFLKKMLDLYTTLSFINEVRLKPKGGYTIVDYTTNMLLAMGLKNTNKLQSVAGFNIYPSEYFSPIDLTTKRKHITRSTCTIHWYMGSWTEQKLSQKIKDTIRVFFARKTTYLF